MPVFDSDRPYEFDKNRAVNNSIIYTYEMIMDNMLTKEEVIAVRLHTKLGVEHGLIAIALDCNERTAQRHIERAVRKLKNIAKIIDFSKAKQFHEIDEKSEKLIRELKEKYEKNNKNCKKSTQINLF